MLIRALVVVIAVGVAPPAVAFGQVTPPAAPSSLQANVIQDALGILLTWQDNADNEDSYVVERSTAGANGPWQVVATLAPNSVNHADGGLTDGVTYWYRVAALNSAGASYSNVGFGTATDLPMPPTPVSPPPSVELPDAGGEAPGSNSAPWLALGVTLAVAAFAAAGVVTVALGVRRRRRA